MTHLFHDTANKSTVRSDLYQKRLQSFRNQADQMKCEPDESANTVWPQKCTVFLPKQNAHHSQTSHCIKKHLLRPPEVTVTWISRHDWLTPTHRMPLHTVWKIHKDHFLLESQSDMKGRRKLIRAEKQSALHFVQFMRGHVCSYCVSSSHLAVTEASQAQLRRRGILFLYPLHWPQYMTHIQLQPALP